ncbi:putative SAC3/GANP domain protein associated with nuclear localization of protein [Naematelia encephala]|uniref:Putative SAC3/GANP domain protein associated with nuclear localization of protein n=1 Tax=Naematelia encephala TaxID=71784 RepID=A0A1Y2BBC9_9TREE|nr:putative SAC3/GANP domain protein associated with nuclear localization of protein [Naematelia encephala]
MSSSWPPQLKQWVQDCLAKATPSNKTAVNNELKQILFRAHADGTINTTDWNTVQLASLKAQTARTTYVPPPPVQSYVTPHPPPSSTYASAFPPLADKSRNDAAHESKGTIHADFPSAYQFKSNKDSEMLARRAARFAGTDDSGPKATPPPPIGVGGWFGGGNDDDDAPSGGMVPIQVGLKKMRGLGGMGYARDIVEVDPNVINWDRFTIKGTNTKLEKRYLRLTSEPSPADIRPLHVLQQTLQLLKRKWKDEHNYAYAVDQFKSVRQDLTVQRIKNEFTVEVYEIHARIALEAKDLGEYNQCQSMLRQLYELGIKGHPQEFLSYRIIYLLHTRNRSDMAALLAHLTPAEKADPGVHHALQVHASLATSNYVRFFRLYNSAPNMTGYIMDHFVERERMSALAIISKAYLSLTLPYLTTTLAFDSDEETDSFLSSHNAAIYTNATAPLPPPTPLHERLWDCKKAHPACLRGTEKYRVVDLKGQVD